MRGGRANLWFYVVLDLRYSWAIPCKDLYIITAADSNLSYLSLRQHMSVLETIHQYWSGCFVRLSRQQSSIRSARRCHSCYCCSFLCFQFPAVFVKLLLPGQMIKSFCSMCLDLRPFTSSTRRARQLCRKSKLRVFVPNQTTDTPGNISLPGDPCYLTPVPTPPTLLIPQDFLVRFG